jgi:hypothetical protein
VIRATPRAYDHYAGSRWLVHAVTIVAILLLMGWLLAALQEAEERAEKLMVELTWRNMRTGLQIAVGEALMSGRDGEIAGWEGSNPVRWLGAEPGGYRGECTARFARELPKGAWCFDRERRELVYRPRNDRHLRMEGAGGHEKLLRWRVAAAAQEPERQGLAGLRVESVTAYFWLEQ